MVVVITVLIFDFFLYRSEVFTVVSVFLVTVLLLFFVFDVFVFFLVFSFFVYVFAEAFFILTVFFVVLVVVFLVTLGAEPSGTSSSEMEIDPSVSTNVTSSGTPSRIWYS